MCGIIFGYPGRHFVHLDEAIIDHVPASQIIQAVWSSEDRCPAEHIVQSFTEPPAVFGLTVLHRNNLREIKIKSLGFVVIFAVFYAIVYKSQIKSNIILYRFRKK